jgi:serine phosphatase RsbU (regulator of sigma subunit)
MPVKRQSKRTRLRIYITVYGGLILLSAYLIGHNYRVQLRSAEESTLSKLYGIASTLAEQVDRDAVKGVFESFPLDGDTSGLSNNQTFQMYRQLFNRTVVANRLKTPIYTLTYDSVGDKFTGGLASNGQSAYGWHYESPPKELKTVYYSGGTISRFDDDHGTWLTAVCPLKDSEGNVFAVIEADYPFDSFISEARNELLGGLLVSILVMILIGIITYPILNKVLRDQEQATTALEKANEAVSEKNAEVKSSLEYARTIQETMLPTSEELNGFFASCMVFNKPRDIVSGDFYWFHQIDESKALVAVADCTGHGVPGALMSIMGQSYLDELVVEQKVESPSQILERLNQKVKATFGGSEQKDGTDGMDIGICLINKTARELIFAGARRPLTIVSGTDVLQFHGTRRGIGEHYLTTNIPFEDTSIAFDHNATYYLCTDGLQDQFGGLYGKKLMRKRVLNWLTDLEPLPMSKRAIQLDRLFKDWKEERAQIDDICVLGFSV